MPKNPLAEVFGYPVDNMSQDAINHRQGGLCPFHNSSGLKCTKNSAIDPLGVCTIFERGHLVVTCPVRLRQDLKIVADTAEFFFPGSRYVPLTEARLKDKQGRSAGNIDIVIAALDDRGKVADFGAVEVQAVYISGNIGKVFKEYMRDPAANYAMKWPRKQYPTPDYLSSSRKRLAPQLIYKGGILHEWGTRIAVVVHKGFFDRLPALQEVDKSKAEVAWLVYDFRHDQAANRYVLVSSEVKYTEFQSALATITQPTAGNKEEFIAYLNRRIGQGKTMGSPPPSSTPPQVEPLPDLLEEAREENADEAGLGAP